MLRRLLRRMIRLVHGAAVRPGSDDDLGRSAMVFAPHFDDETLGCGGLILRKRRIGADVTVVFMTDGCRSHSNLMPGPELAAIRQSEGLAACRALGVDDSKTVMLLLEERTLKQRVEAAAEIVGELLARHRPAEVYIPYRKDGHVDHNATNRIVLLALRRAAHVAVVNEYPIWFWYKWPWVKVPFGNCRQTVDMVRRSVMSISGVPALMRFRHRVAIADVLDEKRAALGQHVSQTTRLREGTRWPILGDVSDGEWLECFFQGHEIFRRYLFRL